MNNAISIKNFSWKYPNFTGRRLVSALKDITLDVNENETLGIIGANGSGKTTLCLAMAGIIPYQMNLVPEEGPEYMNGEVRVFGKQISMISKNGAERLLVCNGVASPTVGLVMQNPESQFLTTSVKEELYLGLRFFGVSEKEADIRVKQVLKVVGLASLYRYIDQIHPSELSGGQKQRLVIACFIAMRPRVLILDEPTSDLDPIGKFEVVDAIKRVKRNLRLTIIITEQDPEIINRIADRVVLLSDGRIRAHGTPFDLYSNKDLNKRFPISRPELLEVASVAGIKATDPIGSLAKKIRLRPESKLAVKSNLSKPKRTIVETKGLKFAYNDGVIALDGIDLQIKEGDFIALIGQNGSGKTTLAQVLSGIEPFSCGNVKAFGLDLSAKKNRRKIHSCVSYIFQNPDHQLFARTVHDEVACGLRGISLSTATINKLTNKALNEVGLANKSQEDPIFLNYSEKKKLTIACALATKPRLIIADEPLMGQDSNTSKQTMHLLKTYNKNGGSVVLITHNMGIAAEHCERSLVMKDGRIIYDGSTLSFFTNSKLLKSASLNAPKSVLLSQKLVKLGILDHPMAHNELCKLLDSSFPSKSTRSVKKRL